MFPLVPIPPPPHFIAFHGHSFNPIFMKLDILFCHANKKTETLQQSFNTHFLSEWDRKFQRVDKLKIFLQINKCINGRWLWLCLVLSGDVNETHQISTFKLSRQINNISVIFNDVLPELFFMHMQYVCRPQRVCDMTHAWPLYLYVEYLRLIRLLYFELNYFS